MYSEHGIERKPVPGVKLSPILTARCRPRSARHGILTWSVCSFGNLTILKVTHHGSNTSSTPLFLSRFPPKVAVIQCGVDNPYGHPTPETLDRLQRVGAKVFRKDEDGDVIATIEDQELKVAVTKR